MGAFDSITMTILQKQLDASAMNQKVIANNIANVNTPGFKKSTVSFQDQLKAAMGQTVVSMARSNSRHFGPPATVSEVKPTVSQVTGTTMGYNHNNVDIEQEMVNLAANSLTYQTVTRALGDRYTLLNYVIKGR